MRYLSFSILLFVTGCGVANPYTSVSYTSTGFKVYNSKDVSVTLKNAKYNPDSHEASIEELIILDTASTVRSANVEQLNAVTNQIKEAMAPISKALDKIPSVPAAP